MSINPSGPWWVAPSSRGLGRKISLRSAIVFAVIVGVIAGAFGASSTGSLFGHSVNLVKSTSTIERPVGSVAEIAQRVLPSVVSIEAKSADGGATGSGFVIDSSGYILTNNHVIAASVTSGGDITVRLNDGSSYDAKVVGRDSSYDLAVLKIIGASLLHISTDYVFNGDYVLPISEDEKQNPLNKYGESKANAEILLTERFKGSVVILRTAWLYGPKGKNFARMVIAKAINNKDEEIRVVNDQWGQPTSTLDLAQKIIELGNKRVKTGIYHGTNSGKTNWYEFAKYLLESAELDSTAIKPINSLQFPTPVERPRYSVLSHEGWKDIGIIYSFGIKKIFNMTVVKTNYFNVCLFVLQ